MTIDAPSIPNFLRQHNHWLCWKYETRNGKATKPPMNPHTGGYGDSTDPATWGTFEQAVAAWHKYGFAGIGFALDHSRVPLVGIDLDNCLADGLPTDLASRVISTVSSYAEVSPSGNGIRIFVAGDLPPEIGNGTNQKPFEAYKAGRYLTVTGNHLPGTPTEITHRNGEIDTVCRWMFPKKFEPSQPTPSAPSQPTSLADTELLQAAMAASNGAKFSLLWNGQWQGNGWPSQSDADLALCNLLAFYTGNDAHRIDALFRQSGLMRDKWDRKTGQTTYGQLTISRAITGTRETYTPPVGISIDDIILHQPSPPPDRLAQLFPHFTLAEGMALPPPDWLVFGAIARGEIGMLFGDSAAGKTYLAVDLAVNLAGGLRWMGDYATGQPRRVLYFTAEGARGFFRRVAAAANGLNVISQVETNLTVVSKVPQLFSEKAERFVAHFVELWQQQGRPAYDLIVLDTLHKASIGTDENTSKEAGLIISRATWLQEEMGSPALLLVHHTNKAGGYRGSSSYRADMDFMFKLEGQHREPRLLTVDKLRDTEPDGLTPGEKRVALFRMDENTGQSYVTWLDRGEAEIILEPPDKREVARDQARQEIIEIITTADDVLSKSQLASRVKTVSINTASRLVNQMLANGELVGQTVGKATFCILPQSKRN